MREDDKEYLAARDKWMKEEYEKAPQKPNGMFGHMGWFAVKSREFKEKLTKEGLLNKYIGLRE